MPPKRPASSQNSQANNDVPLPLEGLSPRNAEGLYRYLETLIGLVECQDRAIETQALGQPSSSKGTSFDDFKKLGKFVRLEQGDMTVAQYEAKFTELSCFAPQLIATKEKKALKFQDGLKPYLKNKISILKLGVYLEVVDKALIAEKDIKELQQPCYKESRACFGCGKHGHMIQNCPENKKFIIGKPKKEHKENKQKPRVQGRMFAMTHQDAQATFDVATDIRKIREYRVEDLEV
uniref:CCHC-type domain-containing protein n=1 Tax=Vitis vinifera TaxID=29760 RepID=A5B7K2_VITVI|nr:hypothetical protein VITISV_002783 [Vitis vinifera]